MPNEKIRVEAGIAWLDKHYPADWPNKIDLERFDINWPCDCVLGQMDDWNYEKFQEMEGDRWEETFIALGFHPGIGVPGIEVHELNEEWIVQITKRQEQLKNPSEKKES